MSFSTIKGVVQDVAEIILNLKQIRFKQQIDSIDSETAILKVSNSESVTAKDIASSLSNFQVLNTDQLICELDKSISFLKWNLLWKKVEDTAHLKKILKKIQQLVLLQLIQFYTNCKCKL